MDVRILNELPGRMRVGLRGPVPVTDVDALEQVVMACPLVTKATVYPRIGSLAIQFDADVPGARDRVVAHLVSVDAAAIEHARLDCAGTIVPRTHTLLMDLAWLVGKHCVRRWTSWLVPTPVKVVSIAWRFWPFFRDALESLGKGRLDVPVLDAAAIGISLVNRDLKTAGETMFLLRVGETLEEYTRARSEHDLINSLLAAPETAQLVEGDQEISVPSAQLKSGDLVVVRTGMPVCVDGTVERGVAMVNQAALTGEPLAVERAVGDDVFAGTAVEDGEIFVRVRTSTDATKLRSIVSLVEHSEALKSNVQARREALADRVVPWNFLLAGVVALTTRSLVKTSAALMVDYSCALKLTGSIAVLSAMRQSVKEGFVVKGSKHFEAMANADTIVFDKTGTLTNATPEVAVVAAFGDWDRTQVLRFSACLEEHFPHPVARAVVRAAAEQGLEHRERHAEVEYIVAHGIASSLDGKRCVIGSEHFVVEDEHVEIPQEARDLIAAQFNGYSPLYLAVDGRLVGAIGITDPLKDGVPEAVAELRKLGFKHVVMLTGDSQRAADAAARVAGITEYCANMLPEAKHAYVEQLKADGYHVVMVGDGVNDSPALALADVGIAMGGGTAIAKEVADITLSSGDLMAIARLRRLSGELMQRMDKHFTGVMAFNSALLALGIAGVISPQLSSLLHNGSTVAFSVEAARGYRLS